jgi:uncharacterized protein YdbL (DUF1318 family)
MPNASSIRTGRRSAVLFCLGMLAGVGWAATAWSATLEQAKSQGLVGEQPNGYLGVVVANASGEVQSLVADINKKRKVEYQGIARRNNTSVEAVEALAGKKAIERTPPGQFVRLPSGQWVKK